MFFVALSFLDNRSPSWLSPSAPILFSASPAAIRKLHGRRCITGLAFMDALVSPFRDRVDVALREATFVHDMLAGFLIGKPGRHGSSHDRVLQGSCPRARLFVRQQRHRRNLSRTMASLAILLKNRLDILVKRHRSDRRRCAYSRYAAPST